MAYAPRRSVLPVGLYATLVAALACLLAPQVPRRVEDLLRGLVVIPLRAYSAMASEVHATARVEDGADAAVVDRFLAASAAQAARPPAPLQARAAAPEVCRVVDRRSARGARRPDVLVLERPHAEVAACRPEVTAGGVLVGYLARGGDGRAEVELLHHVPRGLAPRRLPVEVVLGDGATMRALVEPAKAIDPWPLRLVLPEDPFALRRWVSRDLPVRVAPPPEGEPELVSAGLPLGTLLTLGYETGGHVVPIGWFVRPDADPAVLATVALWRDATQGTVPAALPPRRRRQPVRWSALAAPGGAERWFVSVAAEAGLVPGLPLVRGHRLLGLIDRAGTGYALADPVGVAGQAWQATLVPEEPGQPLQDAVLVVRAASATEVVLEVVAPREGLVGRGHLLTAGQGGLVPPGLLLGRVRPGDGSTVVLERTRPEAGMAVLLPVQEGGS